MNFRNPSVLCLALVAVTLFPGCKDKEPVKIKTGQVFDQAPYKTISDSIRKYPDVPGMYLERAIRLSQNKKLDLATPDFKKAWELSQDENVALEYISNLLLVNKLDDAMAVLNEGIQKFPDNTEFRRRLGEIHTETENYQAALAEYDFITQHESDNFEAWYDKGNLLAKLKDTAGAIDALEKSFALQPISFTGVALANLFISKKDPRALQICNYLIQKDTAKIQTDALFTKGMYYSETGKHELALEQFEECIRRDWKLTDAYIEKGIIFYQQKKLDSALRIFNLSVTVSNTNADGYFWIGRCFEAMNDNDKAVENYQRALSLDRTFREAAQRIKRIRNT